MSNKSSSKSRLLMDRRLAAANIRAAAICRAERELELLRPCYFVQVRIKRIVLADDSITWEANFPDEYGVKAEGKTPEEAYRNFDRVWKYGEPQCKTVSEVEDDSIWKYIENPPQRQKR